MEDGWIAEPAGLSAGLRALPGETGLFAGVTPIQRVDTQRGAPPPGG